MENDFVVDARRLLLETEEWKQSWKHKRPCKEWEQQKWCKHYVDARYRKFKDKIVPLFELESEKR